VEQLKELARFAARIFDYVILDTPGAYNEVVAAALEVATQVLMVSSVDVASIKDTSFVLDVLEGQKFPPERLMLVVNHPNGANTIGAAEIGQLLLRPIFWEIPHDLEMTLASQIGVPVVLAKPRSRAAANFAALAARITGKAIAPRPESKNLLRRLIPAGSRN
jgi:pilus assembly protein CpaE